MAAPNDLLVLAARSRGVAEAQVAQVILKPEPYTLHTTPYTLHPSPFTLHPTPELMFRYLRLHPEDGEARGGGGRVQGPYSHNSTPGVNPETQTLPKP